MTAPAPGSERPGQGEDWEAEAPCRSPAKTADHCTSSTRRRRTDGGSHAGFPYRSPSGRPLGPSQRDL